MVNFSINAQKGSIRKGDNSYKMFAFADAIKYYEKALKKDSMQQDVIFKLANCYRLINNRERALNIYGRAVTMPKCEPGYKYYYATMLMNNGKYAQARKWMENFLVDYPTDRRGKLFIRAIDTYKSFFVDSNDYTITKLDINSPNSDFGAAFYNDGIVFTSNREHPDLMERKHTWTNLPFLAVYYAKGKENKFNTPELFNAAVQTKFNDGPACFSKKGDEIYITRNNVLGNKIGKSKDKIVKLEIYSAKSDGNNWTDIKPFKYNNNECNVAHPALSPDGKRLFFSSDMPGGKGGMDLYVCEKSGDSWGQPVNLGDTINTNGNELFPEVMDDGTLYFSSDAHPGIGGLDIFYSREINGNYLPAVNAGYPINSSDDDFAFIYDNKNKIGYISSNRANKGFDDDLYSFKRRSIHIKGILVNRETGEPINQGLIELSNGTNNKQFVTQENGRFDFPADFEQQYTLKGSMTNMGDSTVSISTIGAPPGDPFIRIELGKPYQFSAMLVVTDAETHQPIAGATVLDELNDRVVGTTDASGVFRQPMVPDVGMQLLTSKDNYRSRVVMMDPVPKNNIEDKIFNVELKEANNIHPFEDWYRIIYYDLDKYNIRSDAVKVLDEVSLFLKEHPEVVISMSSHTDSRASAAHNAKLSENRSKSVRKYFIDQGVNPKQLAKVIWDGENVLVNNCGDGVPCTEEEHQLNRRTEITVYELIPNATTTSTPAKE